MTEKTKTIPVHISQINPGDTVLHNGEVLTVCKKDIKFGNLFGKTLFGDSYHAGYKSVTKVVF